MLAKQWSYLLLFRVSLVPCITSIYHTHHTGLTVSILLPVPPERQDKHLEPPQPISQHRPRACEQLWAMSEGNDVWLPCFLSPETRVLSNWRNVRGFFPYLSSKAEPQTQCPVISLCTDTAFGGGQGAAVDFLKLFLLNQLRLQPQKEFKAGRRTKGAVIDCYILGRVIFLRVCLK